MLFDDDFFDTLPESLPQAIFAFTEKFDEFNNSLGRVDRLMYYDIFIDAYAALEAFIDASQLEIEKAGFISDRDYNIAIIIEYFQRVKAVANRMHQENFLAESRYKYQSKLGKVFSYKFTEGDLKKIQGLINELREQIEINDLLSEEHKRRLFKRLEALQRELHKRMSNLDRFYGLIGEAGIILGKFGNDVKPLVDRIREILGIVWRVQAIAEELPSDTPMPQIEAPKDLTQV